MAAEILDGFGRPDGLIINGVNIVITPYLKTVPDSTNPFAKLPVGSFRSIEPVAPGTLTNSAGINWTLLQFDHFLTSFALDVVGPQKSGHVMVAYDFSGNEVARAAIPYSGPDVVNTYHVSVVASGTAAIKAIRLFVPDNNDVYYTNLAFVISATNSPIIPVPVVPPTTIPPVLTPPATGSSGPTQAQILASYISLSEPEVDRIYVKDSLIPLAPEDLMISNNAPNIDIVVSIRGIAGVSITPSDFVLRRETALPLKILFDTPTINQLADGVNRIDCAINLAVSSFTPLPSGTLPPPPTGSTTVPPPAPGTGQFLEERFHGSPGTNGKQSETAIFGQPPFLTKTVSTINYTNIVNPIASPTTVRWSGVFAFTPGTYTFKFTTDDGMRVFVDDINILDAWKTQKSTTKSVNHTFIDTNLHKVRVEYFNDVSDCTAQFSIAPFIAPAPPSGGGGGGNQPLSPHPVQTVPHEAL